MHGVNFVELRYETVWKLRTGFITWSHEPAKRDEKAPSSALGAPDKRAIRPVQLLSRQSHGEVRRIPLLRGWVNSSHDRRHPTTFGVPLTSKPILGGSTWVTPPRCSTRNRLSS
jgi:hypothetical protein